MNATTRAIGSATGVLTALVLGLGALSIPAASATEAELDPTTDQQVTELDEPAELDADSEPQSGANDREPQSGEPEHIAEVSGDAHRATARTCVPGKNVEIPVPPADRQAFLGASSVLGGGTLSSHADIPVFTTISGGTGTIVAQTDDLDIWTWGEATQGESLTGVSQPTLIYRTTEVGGDYVAFQQFAFQSASIFALDQDCRLWAWGDNSSGQLGLGVSAPSRVDSPRMVMSVAGTPLVLKRVDTSPYFMGAHSVGLDMSGRVWTWGGTAGNGGAPRMHARASENFSDIALSDEDGVVWAYGIVDSPDYAYNGMVAYWNATLPGSDPNSEPNYVLREDFQRTWTGPEWLPDRCDADNFRFDHLGGSVVSRTGAQHTMLAVSNCGTAWLIKPTPGMPVQASPIGTAVDYQNVYVQDATANSNAVAVLNSDTSSSPVWTWGTNQWGLLGVGKSESELAYQESSLLEVTALRGKDITEVTTGGEFVFATERDGTLWGWGDNSRGQLTLAPRAGVAWYDEIYSSPVMIPFLPAASVTVGDEAAPTTNLQWVVEDGKNTGNYTVTLPEHQAGYYPVFEELGASFAGNSAVDFEGHQIGNYGFLFPLSSIDHDSPYKVRIGGELEIEGGIDGRADLSANASLEYSAPDTLQVTAGAWNGTGSTWTVDADKRGTYPLTVWAQIDGDIVSYNPQAECASNPMDLADCVGEQTQRLTGAPEWATVSAELEFTGDIPLFIQKMGETTGGSPEPMCGSTWALFDAENSPVDIPAATEEDMPAEAWKNLPSCGADSAAVFYTELTPGTEDEPATYRLRETKALEGFQLLAEDVKFSLWADEDGEIRLELTGGASDIITTHAGETNPFDQGDDSWAIFVQDVPQYTLPQAEGSSLTIFAIVGAAIGGIALAVAMVTRKGRARGRHSA